MRILAIRLQNLNSLRGPMQEVRFDAAPLAQAGVFLITGPTGSGKSTLLDAMTLALYGRAARYGSDKPDEMMSRHTAESLAEVEFECRGRSFCATWRMRRAGKKLNGKLQPPERRLSELQTGTILAEKAGEMDRLIEEITGLDAARFLRSVLLAQGQFAAFLKAKPKERAELLEKITGTEIYSTLSRLAHTTYESKKDAVTTLQTRLQTITVLTEEEETALKEQGALMKREGESLAVQEAALAKKVEHQSRLQQWQKDLNATTHEISQLLTAEQSAAQHRTTLLAEQTIAQAAVATARTQQTARQPVWDQAKVIEAQVEAHERRLDDGRADYTKQKIVLQESRTKWQKEVKALATHDATASSLNAWLKEHAADAALSTALGPMRQDLRQWQAALLALETAQKVRTEAAEWKLKIQESRQSAQTLEQEAQQSESHLVTHRESLAQLTQQHEFQQQVTENAGRAAGLSEHRSQLRPGEPCPLCGAAEHPYATAEHAFESQWRSAQQLLHSLHQKLNAARQQETFFVASLSSLKAQSQAAARLTQERQSRLDQLQEPDDTALRVLESTEDQIRLPLFEKLHSWLGQISFQNTASVEKAIADLEQRQQDYTGRVQESQTGQEKRQQSQLAEQSLAIDCQAREERLQELTAQMLEIRSIADALKDQLRACLGDLTPEQDRQAYADRVTQSEQVERALVEQLQKLNQQLASFQAKRESFEQRSLELKAHLQGHELVSAETLAQWTQQVQQHRQQMAERQKALGALEEKLRRDALAKSERQTFEQDRLKAEAEATRWGRLKELIGSADGTKFARFAQLLTLRQLVGIANRHLTALAPRYRLMAAEGDELDLRTIDLFQAGVDRPMESLSGGESFLASLALALSLSELAGRHHAIDSLFIDEGFGTLDSETLEIALSALENLRATGKTIGLISHVDLLKERLTTQVRILRGPEGTSHLHVTS